LSKRESTAIVLLKQTSLKLKIYIWFWTFLHYHLDEENQNVACDSSSIFILLSFFLFFFIPPRGALSLKGHRKLFASLKWGQTVSISWIRTFNNAMHTIWTVESINFMNILGIGDLYHINSSTNGSRDAIMICHK